MHDGHRGRLKKRFAQEGLDRFEPHNALELLLFYSIPRCDTNETAHMLLKAFGSLSGVFDASVEDLQKVPGVGENSALLIKMIPALNKMYMEDKLAKGVLLNSVKASGEFLVPKFMGENNEIVIVVSLDNQGKVKNCSRIAEGGTNTAPVNNRKIVETALRHNATSIILAHNHPGGLANPSKSDVETTMQLVRVLESVQICLRDHIIVAGKDWFSLADSRLYGHIFNY